MPVRFRVVSFVFVAVFALVVVLPGCDSNEADPVFRDLDEVAIEAARWDTTGTEPRTVLAVREGGRFRMQDTLRLQPDARYGLELRAPSLEDPAYLTTAGPPAVLSYRRSAPLREVLTLRGTGTMTLQPLATSSFVRPPAKTTPGAKTSPAVPLSVELLTADSTGVSGRLRLRLERSREAGGETEHVDFDININVLISSI